MKLSMPHEPSDWTEQQSASAPHAWYSVEQGPVTAQEKQSLVVFVS
jgi:hypothetical protein